LKQIHDDGIFSRTDKEWKAVQKKIMRDYWVIKKKANLVSDNYDTVEVVRKWDFIRGYLLVRLRDDGSAVMELLPFKTNALDRLKNFLLVVKKCWLKRGAR